MGTLTPLFREDKATQVAARLISHEGGEVNVLKLVKLVYLVDRAALLGHGRPVTFDMFFNMQHGPVVGSTMDCINAVPGEGTAPYWSTVVGPRHDHLVALIGESADDQLSDAEVSTIDTIYDDFGDMEPFEIRDYTHGLPEYRDPTEEGVKRSPLKYQEVLKAAGWDDADIDALIDDLGAEVQATRIAG